MLETLIQTVVQSAMVVLVPMGVAAAVQVLRRLQIQLTHEQEVALTGAVRRAVFEAEEWAAGRLKAKLPVTSYQKLQRATDSVAKPFGLTPQAAESHIKALLPQLGLGAAATQWGDVPHP